MGVPTPMLLPLRFPLNQGYIGTLNWVLSLLLQLLQASPICVCLNRQSSAYTCALKATALYDDSGVAPTDSPWITASRPQHPELLRR